MGFNLAFKGLIYKAGLGPRSYAIRGPIVGGFYIENRLVCLSSYREI